MSAAACKAAICFNKLAASVEAVNREAERGAYGDRQLTILAEQVDAAADNLNRVGIELAGTGGDSDD